MDRRTFIAVLGGSILAQPLATEAQQAGKVYRIGWFALSQPTNPEIAALHDAVLQELRAQGFVEGQNVRIERRYTEGREERATALAAELVSMKVDVIFATYSGLVRAAKEATSTIPIVMGAVANPERQGLIASLARPGGNVTGTSSIGAESGAKLLQIAKDALPQPPDIGVKRERNRGASGHGVGHASDSRGGSEAPPIWSPPSTPSSASELMCSIPMGRCGPIGNRSWTSRRSTGYRW